MPVTDSFLDALPQKNAFIIDEDRDFALKVAAALRTDGLKVALSEGERDPIDEIKLERPDIVVMRAEGRGTESGFSVCNRVKKSKRLSGVSVLLYTDDTDTKKLETHKTKTTAADDYVVLPSAPPYSFDDIRDRVRGVLFSNAADRPPPLPNLRPDVRPVSEEDSAFLDKVMDSLKRREDEPPAPPAVRRDTVVGRRTTADAKLDLLRQKLRQREAELAKVMEMYRAKEREHHEWNEKLVERDVEVQSLRMTIDELQASQDAARNELDRRTEEFNASFEQLLEDKVTRENELIQVVAGKERGIADLEGKLRRSHEEHEEATRRFTAAESEAEGLKRTLEERDHRVGDLEKSLSRAEEQNAAAERTIAGQTEQIAAAEENRLRLEGKVLEIRAGLAQNREELDAVFRDHQFELKARDEIIAGLQSDVAQAEAQGAQLEDDLRQELVQAAADFDAATEELAVRAARIDALETELVQLRSTTDSERKVLEDEVTGLVDRLSAEKQERAATEEALREELAATHARVDHLSAELESIRAKSEEVRADLESQLASATLKVAELGAALEDERQAHETAVTNHAAELSRLEDIRASTEKAHHDREADLANEIRAQASLVAQRDEELTRLGSQLQEERARAESAVAAVQADLQKTREQAEATENELRDQLIELGAELASRADKLEAVERDLAEERQGRAQVDRQCEALSRTLETTKGELDTTTGVLRNTEQSLVETQRTLALNEGRLSETQEMLRKTQEKASAVEESLSELRTAFDARGSEIGRLEGRIAVLNEHLASGREQFETLQGTSEESKQELARAASALAAAEAGARERAEERDHARARLAELGRALDELRAERDEARKLALRTEEKAQGRADRAADERAHLEEELSKLRAQAEAQERELTTELAARHNERDSLRDDLNSVRQELALERRTRTEVEQRVQRLLAEAAQMKDTSDSFRLTSDEDRRQLVLRVEALEQEKAELVSASDQSRAQLEAALADVRARLSTLTDERTQEQARFESELDRVRRDAAVASNRLEEMAARASTLETEKIALGQDRSRSLEAKDAELERSRTETREVKKALAGAEGRLAKLEDKLQELRRDREDGESRYLRELEEVHESHMRKAQTADEQHSREIDELRRQALEARRQLKTSELAVQRLTDRLKKLEDERPLRSGAAADFESFISQFTDPSLPLPTTTARSGRRPRSPHAPDTAKPPVPSADAARPRRARKPASSVSGSIPTPGRGAQPISALSTEGAAASDKKSDPRQEAGPDRDAAQPGRVARRPRAEIRDRPSAGKVDTDKETEDFLAAFDNIRED